MAITIPAFMLTDAITIEPYEGETGSGGPKFGEPVEMKAHLEPRRKMIVDRRGAEARSDLFALVAPGTNVPAESRVTIGVRTYRVLDTFDVPAPGGGTHHIEIGMMFGSR